MPDGSVNNSVALLPLAERGLYNRKDTTPSASMLASDGRRYKCPWLEDSITVHSDGNVSCGLDDPHGRRSFGNLTTQSVAEVFANPEFAIMQDMLWHGHRCSDCSLYQLQLDDAAPPRVPRQALPSTAVIETTVKCNLRCPNAACQPNNDASIRTRDRNELPVNNFRNIVDQLAGSLKQVYFFNYGDPFFHRDAPDMLLYLRSKCPDAKIVTSTNAIPLAARAKADKVVASGLDHMTVTLSGVAQASYARYHVNGQVGQALLGLQNVCDAKRELAQATPVVTWRYLVFRWNDSEVEIDAAIALSKLYGVDAFSLYLTHLPEGAASYRLAPGTPAFLKYRSYISTVHGYPHGPDADGFYSGEDLPALGRARWTAFWAQTTHRRQGHWLRLSVSTNRPNRVAGQDHCFISTSWTTQKVPLAPMAWQDVSILVPWELREESTFQVSIITFDCWFPVEENFNSADFRCLGVLVKDDTDSPADARDDEHMATLRRAEAPNEQDRRRISQLSPELRYLSDHNNAGRFSF
jgi:MoaA/NifB/PqqE/SkfB family radical SAM enzyme